MKALKDDDYLLEIKVRVAVRNEDAAAVIVQGPKLAKDKTEEDKLASAIFHLIEKALAKHGDLVQAEHFKARRIPSVAEFHDFVNETFRQIQQPKGPQGPQIVQKRKKEDPGSTD